MGRINQYIDLDSPKVATMDKLPQGGKKVYCRCWKSDAFPLCDGAHMAHNKETGDNLGPLICSAAKPIPDDSSSNDAAVTSKGGGDEKRFFGKVKALFKPKDDGLTGKERLAKMGLSALLSYGFVSNMSYSVAVSLAWYGFSKTVSFYVKYREYISVCS